AANAPFSAGPGGSAVVTATVTGIAVALAPVIFASHAALISDTRLYIVELAPLGLMGAIGGALSSLLSVRGKFVPAVAVMGFDPLLRTCFVIVWGHRLGVQSVVLANLVGAGAAVALLYALVR